MKIFLNTTNLKNPKIEITKTYEVGVEVIENPSEEPDKITYTTYEVEAITEDEAKRKASRLCVDEFCQLPYTTEII